MHKSERSIAFRLTLGAMAYLMLPSGVLGIYPGYNYDSYQYAYAAVKGAGLSPASLAEFSRMHVHSGYYPFWRLLVVTGLPAWAAFTWLSVLATALTAGVLYLICRQLKISSWLAALAVAFFLSSTSVAYYGSIPEVYAPWMLFLAIFIWAVLAGRPNMASFAYGLALWMFLQSLLLWPLFFVRGKHRWVAATSGLVLGSTLHLGTLYAYSVPFLPRIAGEAVYFRVISGWQWFFSSTWSTLSLAGVLWVAILYSACALRSRKSSLLRRLELLTLLSLLAPAIWVKDHGSFFLPFILLLILLSAAALHKWTKQSRARSFAAVCLVLLLLATNLRTTWRTLEFDRRSGLTQLTYCSSALRQMPENSRVLSTSLLSTWLWACLETGRNDVKCSYFPWMLRADYGPVLEAGLQRLLQDPGTYYVDSSVSSLVSEAGRVISTWQVEVPGWPQGVMSWPLQIIDIGSGTRR